MPQDAFTLRLNALELDKSLRGAKINKINQPEREELVFTVYTGASTKKLVLNANASGCGVYLTAASKENPALPPAFCMLLRKHLLNAEILGVSLVGFERILAVHLFCVSDFSTAERVLYAEIMGKYSNLVLTENGVILGALKTTAPGENCKRLIVPGARYLLPEPQDKTDPTDRSALRALLSAPPERELSDFLFAHVRGIAPATAAHVADGYCGGDFATYLSDYLFSDEISPCVTERDFFARSVKGGVPYATLSEAQDAFYGKRQREKEFSALRRKMESSVNAALKKQKKTLAQMMERRLECQDMELNRIRGELLTASLWKIPQGARGVELENYYDGAGKTEKIPLDPARTPAENAQSYFKKYRKQKRTLEMLAPLEEKAKKEIYYLNSLLAAIGFSEEIEDLLSLREEIAGELLSEPSSSKKKKAEERPSFRTFEKAGFTIFAGRNNLENDRLVRAAHPNDVWLHAQKYHSCHVVIRTEGREVPEEVLLFAASVCALYSEGKGDKVPVDYCAVRSVRKPPRSRPGFVTYSDFKTVYVAPLKA